MSIRFITNLSYGHFVELATYKIYDLFPLLCQYSVPVAHKLWKFYKKVADDYYEQNGTNIGDECYCYVVSIYDIVTDTEPIVEDQHIDKKIRRYIEKNINVNNINKSNMQIKTWSFVYQYYWCLCESLKTIDYFYGISVNSVLNNIGNKYLYNSNDNEIKIILIPINNVNANPSFAFRDFKYYTITKNNNSEQKSISSLFKPKYLTIYDYKKYL